MSHRTCGSRPPCTRHPIHACAPVCCVVVVFSSPLSVLYFVPPLSFQPFQMFSSEVQREVQVQPLCDFRLGTVATSDHETPLTDRTLKPRSDQTTINSTLHTGDTCPPMNRHTICTTNTGSDAAKRRFRQAACEQCLRRRRGWQMPERKTSANCGHQCVQHNTSGPPLRDAAKIVRTTIHRLSVGSYEDQIVGIWCFVQCGSRARPPWFGLGGRTSVQIGHKNLTPPQRVAEASDELATLRGCSDPILCDAE